jgi:hypothetical protein
MEKQGVTINQILGSICLIWLSALLTKIVLDVKAINKINKQLYGTNKKWRNRV